MDNNNFYTLRGYKIKNEEVFSSSMEDYLEMIYRISLDNEVIRVNDLSDSLNVKPPSTTKMIKRLSNGGYVNNEKYGTIKLTDKGKDIGKYLFYRHETIYNFLDLIGVKNNLLEQTEKIEHSINSETLDKIDKLSEFLKGINYSNG